MIGQGRPSEHSDGEAPALLSADDAVVGRRRFLVRMGLLTAGAFILADCSPGCSSRSTHVSPRTGDGLDPFGQPRATPLPVDDPPPLVRPAIPREEPIARVRIASVSSSGGRLTVSHPSGRIEVREGLSLRGPHVASSPVVITRRGSRWDVADRAGTRFDLEGSKPVDLLAPAGIRESLQFNGGSYPGMLRCVVAPSSSGGADLDLVNYLPLEAYLPGVLSKELYSNWHPQAFESQAIAARSFACAEIQHFAERRHFDLTNTQASQAYVGATNLAVAVDAVAATRGRVLSWEGTLVPAYYSSCCGGVASSAADEIGPSFINDIPPLRTRSGPNACTAAPVYRWRVERTVADVSARLRAWGAANGEQTLAKLSEVVSIAPGQVNAFGRPVSIKIVGTRDERVEIPSRKFREAVDFATPTLAAPAKVMRSSFITASFSGGGVAFDGRGYGHGAGMCQYCAQALAQRGVQNEHMLGMFYPGASVVNAFT